ncbi:MAG: hypothetical protein GF375_07955 [Candidatus Omnitrophica bacterium]|nr:hypothetical protein [Candidatus Omnitrophota bacterium]MBD3269892.1 hypothetical protein [Candidatus Omnitrophota bacterium]
MKRIILPLILFFFFIFPSHAAFRLVSGIYDSDIKDVVVSSFLPSLLYVASGNSLYKSKDRGKSFEQVYSFIDERIRRLFFDSNLSGIIYVVSSQHLYEINKGKKKIFTAQEEEEILTAAENKGLLYVGTTAGLYSSTRDFLNWRRIEGLSDASIYWIEPSGNLIYLATSEGVYILQGDNYLKRTFIVRDEEQEDVTGVVPNIIKPDVFDKDKIWLATSEGLFLSKDKGENFRKFFVAGIDSINIVDFAQTELEANALYLATGQGFFRLNPEKREARPLFEGLYTSKVNGVEFSDTGKVYLATAKGLFVNQYFTSSGETSPLAELLKKEPSISFVQNQAMQVNEVSPEKIRRWRKAIAIRALFPEVSLDYDKTIYGSSSGAFAVGPRDWGVSFSWDVGDLFWNPYQDDVDTRGRLNTKLRIDILEEVNRVYFERLRLKAEIMNSSFSRQELFEKKLRIKELTAILDYYTGGKFTKRLKELNGT